MRALLLVLLLVSPSFAADRFFHWRTNWPFTRYPSSDLITYQVPDGSFHERPWFELTPTGADTWSATVMMRNPRLNEEASHVLQIERVGGHFRFRFIGPWADAGYWTPFSYQTHLPNVIQFGPSQTSSQWVWFIHVPDQGGGSGSPTAAIPTVRESGFVPPGLEEQSRDWNVNNWLADMWGSDRSGVEVNDPSLRALVKAFLAVPDGDPPEPVEPEIDPIEEGDLGDLPDVMGETPIISGGIPPGSVGSLSFSTDGINLSSPASGRSVTVPGIDYTINLPSIDTSSWSSAVSTLILASAGLAMGWRVFEELRRM